MCCSVRNVGKWSRDQTSSLDWVMITLENNQDGSRRISSQTPDTRNYQENEENTSEVALRNEFSFDGLRSRIESVRSGRMHGPLCCVLEWV